MTKTRPSVLLMLFARIFNGFVPRHSVLADEHLPIDPALMPIDLSESDPVRPRA